MIRTLRRIGCGSPLCVLAAAMLLVGVWLVEANESRLTIENFSGSDVSIMWINPDSQERLFMMDIEDGGLRYIDTYVDHEFEFREKPLPGSDGECASFDKVCRASTYTISDSRKNEIAIQPGLSVVPQRQHVDSGSMGAATPSQAVEECLKAARAEMTVDLPQESPERGHIFEMMEQCLQQASSEILLIKNEEIQFHREIRRQLSFQLENYTCLDENMASSPDVSTKIWKSERDGIERLVHVKLDQPASRIHMVENFASEAECAAVEEDASDRLRKASVADGKGGTQFSQNRKAMQAGITPKWEKEDDGDLIARLSRRVYDYASYELGLSLTHNGQEPIMSIQYFGRGKNDTEPDRYTPHCDGDCTGKPHHFRTRMATMVIYCTVPDRGGHTNFQNVNVHVKPQAGAAVFFSYIDPATNLTDNGYTQHSGCPVHEGEKKIVTQWIRYGVDDDNKWDSLDTLGISLRESGH